MANYSKIKTLERIFQSLSDKKFSGKMEISFINGKVSSVSTSEQLLSLVEPEVG